MKVRQRFDDILTYIVKTVRYLSFRSPCYKCKGAHDICLPRMFSELQPCRRQWMCHHIYAIYHIHCEWNWIWVELRGRFTKNRSNFLAFVLNMGTRTYVCAFSNVCCCVLELVCIISKFLSSKGCLHFIQILIILFNTSIFFIFLYKYIGMSQYYWEKVRSINFF